MSKYQQFFIVCLLFTLLTGCAALQQDNEFGKTRSHLCKDQQLHLQQGIHSLELDLQQAEARIKLLEAERDSLAAKLEALTAIERSLHERKQRQSNEP